MVMCKNLIEFILFALGSVGVRFIVYETSMEGKIQRITMDFVFVPWYAFDVHDFITIFTRFLLFIFCG